MRFLNKLLELDFVEWNYVTKGLVEVWEFTRTLGLELHFEDMLHKSENAELAILLGRSAHNKKLLELISKRSKSRLSSGWVMSLPPNQEEWRKEKLLMSILEPLLTVDQVIADDRSQHSQHRSNSQGERNRTMQPN